jgi:hypothetical protein
MSKCHTTTKCARPQYPKRSQFHANKFTRLLLKTCAAQEIGPAGAWMLTVIAHTEDASHYRRGVRFYDAQIQAIIGLSSWRALNRARQAAIAAGWLHYEPGGKARAGVYWTLIPESAKGLDDLASDEGLEPQMHLQNAGGSGGENQNGEEMHLRCAGESSVDAQVKGQSKSSPDVPNPNPIPTGTGNRSKRKKGTRGKAKSLGTVLSELTEADLRDTTYLEGLVRMCGNFRCFGITNTDEGLRRVVGAAEFALATVAKDGGSSPKLFIDLLKNGARNGWPCDQVNAERVRQRIKQHVRQKNGQNGSRHPGVEAALAGVTSAATPPSLRTEDHE